MRYLTSFFYPITLLSFATFGSLLTPCCSWSQTPQSPTAAPAETPSECQIGDVLKGCTGEDLQKATLRMYESSLLSLTPALSGFGLENTLQHSCKFTAHPKFGIFEGVLQGQGESASAAKKALDERRSSIQEGIKAIQGELQELEINRYRETNIPNSFHNQGQKSTSSPFIARQRIQIRFNPKMDIDQAIDQLSKLGIEQFNPYWRPGYTNTSQSGDPLVIFDFGDYSAVAAEAEEHCGKEAFTAWCKEQGQDTAKKSSICSKGFETARENLGPRTLYLSSQPISQKNGGTYPITISISPGFASSHQPALNQLTSDAPLHFTGSYSTSIVLGD